LEGILSGDTLEFKWASFIGPCNGRLGVVNKLSLNQDKLVGNWTFDGRTGPAWILLHKSSRITQDLRKSATVRGFEFQLHPCLLNEYTVVCDLVVVNNIEEQQLTFGGDGAGHTIEAYDTGGNRYEPEYVRLANEQSGKTVRHLMITRVPTSARVVFYHFNENATEIVSLKVPFSAQRLGALAVEFQHVPLHW